MCLQNLMNFHHCLFKILKKNQNVTDGHTDGKTDGQRENSIPPTNIICGGIKSFVVCLKGNIHYVLKVSKSLKVLKKLSDKKERIALLGI